MSLRFTGMARVNTTEVHEATSSISPNWPFSLYEAIMSDVVLTNQGFRGSGGVLIGGPVVHTVKTRLEV